MAFVPRPNIDTLAAMTPNERLEAIRGSIITDPADMTPELTKMVDDGWAEYNAARQASPKN